MTYHILCIKMLPEPLVRCKVDAKPFGVYHMQTLKLKCHFNENIFIDFAEICILTTSSTQYSQCRKFRQNIISVSVTRPTVTRPQRVVQIWHSKQNLAFTSHLHGMSWLTKFAGINKGWPTSGPMYTVGEVMGLESSDWSLRCQWNMASDLSKLIRFSRSGSEELWRLCRAPWKEEEEEYCRLLNSHSEWLRNCYWGWNMACDWLVWK